jgi:hypothetical protein
LGLDRTRWPELLLGLERVRVLEVARDGEGRLHVAIETTDELAGCGECGVRAALKDRARVELADLPTFGASVRLVWIKRRWVCREPACGAGTWTEQRPDIAPARAALTTRAGLWVRPVRRWRCPRSCGSTGSPACSSGPSGTPSTSPRRRGSRSPASCASSTVTRATARRHPGNKRLGPPEALEVG